MFFMNDLKTRQDIEILLKNFYEKALKDKVIGYIFTDVAKLDLEHHLPIITDFWEMVLFQTVNFQEKYHRSPMLVHLQLNEKTQLKPEHFQKWLELFNETIDELFSGEKANLAKFRAISIAKTIQMKVNSEKII
jgi:hemoglobin